MSGLSKEGAGLGLERVLTRMLERVADCLQAGVHLDDGRHPGWCAWAASLRNEVRMIVREPDAAAQPPPEEK